MKKSKLRVMPILLAIVMVFTMMPMMGVVYAEGEGQIDKICFDGDSDYDWAHFYSVEGTEETKALDELNITVLDKAGNIVNDEDYDIIIEHFYWDEDQGTDIYDLAESPFGIYDAEKEEGFSEYRATVTAKDGVDVSGVAEGTFFIADKYSLNYVIPEIYFENFSSRDGWRMHDRYWFAPGEVDVPIVKDGSGTALTVREDFEVGFYYRSGSQEDMDNPNVGFEDILVADDEHLVKDGEGNPAIPTEPGAYFVKVEGNDPYYGGNNILIDISDTTEIAISGESEFWSDEDLVLDVMPPTGITGSYRFIVGVRGEDDWNVCFADRDNEADYYEFDEERGKLTLHGEAIFDEIGEGHVNIYANIKDAEETVLAEGFADAYIKEAKYEYNLPGDDNLLPGWDSWIDKNINAWIRNSEYPDGQEVWLQINNVGIKSQEPDDEVLSLDGYEDGWSYRANKHGHATIEISYTDIDDTEKTHEFDVWVNDTVYNVDVWSENGINQGLPGSSLELRANARKATVEKRDNGQAGDGYHEWWHHEETSEGLQYSWSIENGEDFATLEPDAEDPTRAILTFKDMPEGQDRIGENINVEVSVTDANSDDKAEVRCVGWHDFWINDEYFQIYPAIIDSNLDIGKTLTIKPELRLYQFGKEGYETVPDVGFEICDYDHNAIDVDDLTITRKGDWDTNFRIRAYWTQDEREESRYCGYHLSRKNYEVWFEYDDFEIYDDETLTVKLNKDSLERLTEELSDPNNEDYEIKYTVGKVDDQGENWETVLTEGYEADINGITISGQAIKEAGLDGINIKAELIIKATNFGANDDYTRDTWCWLALRESCKDDHHWIKATIKPATCVEKGEEVWICLSHPNWRGCGEVRFVETEDFGPHKTTKVAAKDSTLTNTGNIEHYKCSVCNKRFSDAAGTKEISAASTVVAKKINISGATVAAISKKTYNKAAQKPALTVKYGSTTLKAGTDYTVSYTNNVNVGTAKVTITGKGKYAGTKTVTFAIVKANNPMTVKAKTASVKYTAVSKKNQTIKQSNVCTVASAQGKVTYKKASGDAKITISSAGNVTVKKGLKKGTYKVKVNVTAAGNANYKASTKTVTLTIKVT